MHIRRRETPVIPSEERERERERETHLNFLRIKAR